MNTIKPTSSSLPEAQQFDGEKLLLIEDNDSIRDMFELFFDANGFVVATATNGLDGIELCEDFNPAVCILDIRLPDLDGFEVARYIKKISDSPDVLIALSGHGGADIVEQASQAGFDLHVTKPVDPNELKSAVLKLLASKRTQAEHAAQTSVKAGL